MKNPCFECNQRSISCHAVCELYKGFVEENEKRKKALREKKEIEQHFKSLFLNRRRNPK